MNKNSTLKITPCKIINKKSSYVLKNKIKIFFNCKKKVISYEELYKIVSEYLVKNNLVIGVYFTINPDLSNLLNISDCLILHIDELDNVISYFVKDKI